MIKKSFLTLLSKKKKKKTKKKKQRKIQKKSGERYFTEEEKNKKQEYAHERYKNLSKTEKQQLHVFFYIRKIFIRK